MIVLRNLSQLDAANMRAIAKRPALRILDFGEYEVQGSSGIWYRVTCRKNEHGQRLVFCSCEDKFKRKSNTPCYHMAPAVGAHILLAQARLAAQTVGKVITFPDRKVA